ncbi:flagellar protein FlaG [Halopseudomonas litoralis]|uniref:Flagellar protein FlaG n=1 Tax=Halopseudomonas litoralis TaxID=797277 RepID=A0A1H1TCA4_9GAMM|nr:flagellar protein FlaG [Halopseudomonas litoralis]SDS57606.1 flagellar protein FlaG [Halopseudomonas litoralis]
MDMGSLNNRAGVGAVAPAARTNEITAVTVAQPASETRENDSMTEPDREQVLAAVEEMQEYVDVAARNIQFQLDDESGRMVVKVTEASTGDVIRQMPSEEALRLAENLAEMNSVLFRGEV